MERMMDVFFRWMVCGIALLGLNRSMNTIWAEPTSQQAALDEQLTRAQANLRIARATEARIKADMERLEAKGGVDSKVMEDYTIYLARVRGLVAEYDRIVGELETVYAKAVPSTAPPAKPSDSPFATVVPEPVDELSQLDRELNDSLARFDAFINVEMTGAARKMEEITKGTQEERTELATEAAEAVKRLRERGIELDTPLPEEPGEGEPTEAGGEQSGDPDTEGDAKGEGTEEGEGEAVEKGDESGAKPGSSTGQQSGEKTQGGGGANDKGALGGVPGKTKTREGATEDHGSSSDDDIVARQLREAAESEPDPVLKAKLWKEYEAYKKGQ
ncbi:MAG: hypothetical protein ACI9TH_001071 [Kiritimatiellia bacterium]|jgi:hypothetical protein